MFSAD